MDLGVESRFESVQVLSESSWGGDAAVPIPDGAGEEGLVVWLAPLLGGRDALQLLRASGAKASISVAGPQAIIDVHKAVQDLVHQGAACIPAPCGEALPT